MKSTLLKLLPIVFGLAIGWLLFHPPDWLAPLGPVRYLVVAALCGALLVAFVALQISSSLPADVTLEPMLEGPPAELVGLVDRFRELGFEQVGPPVRVGVNPPAAMVGFVHPREPIMATVFRTGTLPAVTGFDLVSVLHDGRGGLTTGADRRGATLPGGPWVLRQVFPGAGAEELLAHHRDAMAWLRGRGLGFRAVTPTAFAGEFRRAIARQREIFLANPVGSALVALWRSASGRVPHIGPLARQRVAEGQVRRLLAGALLVVVGLAVGCGPRRVDVDPAYLVEIEAWRADRLERLRAEDGWLSLVGLYWLRPGPNSFGSEPGADVVVPDPGLPARAGEIVRADDGSVSVRVVAGRITCDGEVVTERLLRTDAEGSPDVFSSGRIRFHVIARGDRLGVRVKDLDSPTRRRFEGLEHFPVNPELGVEASFEPFEEPRRVSFPTAIGTEDSEFVPGLLHFSLEGLSLTLEPFASDDGGLFIVFRDATSGVETYGAGRFIETGPPVDGRVVLDFNRAYNPPCAFTPFATCPLPPARNHLPVAIRAGERVSFGNH